MLATLTFPTSSYEQRHQLRVSEGIRRRALNRLYERRATVDELISVLERYQDQQSGALAPCVEITAVRKCS